MKLVIESMNAKLDRFDKALQMIAESKVDKIDFDNEIRTVSNEQI